jgi:hypothetical protein
MSKKDRITLVLCLIVLVGLLLLASTDDFENEVVEQEHYCKMVDLWNRNSHLVPEQRPGWPPYKGGCDGQD